MLDTLHPQYVTDADGRPTAVLLSIEAFEAMVEDLEDLAVVAERRDEPTVSHTDVVAELRQDELL